MASLKEARVPDIGGYDDVPVIEVLVAVGDRVTADQGLVTLESDKATMEVPSPFAGVIRELRVKVGDTLSEGGVVAMIEAADDAPAAAPAGGDTARERAASVGEHARPPENETDPVAEPVAVSGAPDNIAQASIDTQAGRTPANTATTPAATAGAAASAAPAPGGGASEAQGAATAPVDTTGPAAPPVRFDADAVAPDKVPYASPAVRLFARELGVDLVQVTGSARGGRITRDDVRGFVKAAMQAGAPRAAAAGGGGGGGLDLLPWPKVDFAKFGPVEKRTLTRIQKISGANLARNWAMIPHVTQHDDADITDLEALRVLLNKENEKAKDGVKLTMLAFLIKASVAALKQFPMFNASLEGDAETLVLKQYFHIGFAADTPNGLVVPVIRDADRKGVLEIARETGELAARAREGKLGPAQMSGGCFSISSLGGIGGTAFTPIVNAPEVAILGVSKSATKPVWDGKQFAPRLLLPLSLSYDHRVIDGAAAARFTAHLAGLLGDMRRVLL